MSRKETFERADFPQNMAHIGATAAGQMATKSSGEDKTNTSIFAFRTAAAEWAERAIRRVDITDHFFGRLRLCQRHEAFYSVAMPTIELFAVFTGSIDVQRLSLWLRNKFDNYFTRLIQRFFELFKSCICLGTCLH